MAEAGVNIEVLYSDHDHRLILVVDDLVRGRGVSELWTHESRSQASVAGAEGFACNMSALTEREREAHHELTRALWKAVQEQTELSNGNGLRLPSEMLVTAAEASLEERVRVALRYFHPRTAWTVQEPSRSTSRNASP